MTHEDCETNQSKNNTSGFGAVAAPAPLEKPDFPARMKLLPVSPSAWEIARKLSNSHSAAPGTQSPGILHVAIATAFRADTFLTFDGNQAALARAEGFQTPL